jgi:hypothetical protein
MHRVELKADPGPAIPPPLSYQFLMHRVELKELPGLEDRTGFNAAFLMHRVELKAISSSTSVLLNGFLMHRVELKAGRITSTLKNFILVPNAPCGVES